MKSNNILKISLLLLGIGIIFSFGVNTTAATNTANIYVNTHGNDNWNGLNSTYTSGINGPKATIKNATGTVKSDGSVYIASGTYNENNITIDKNMNIIGANQKSTVINGKNTGIIFLIVSGVNVNISSLTLTNGNTVNSGDSGYGGAINNNGKLTVTNTKFINNTATANNLLKTAGSGGAISNNGTLIVKDSVFTNNYAPNGDGGAIFNNVNGNATVSSSTFTNNNVSGGGGAIFNYGGTLTLNKDTFTGNNVTYSYGGAIFNDNNGVVNVNTSTFTNNYAKLGGGAIVNTGTLTVKGSAFTANNGADGGAILNWNTLTLNSSKFVKNTATNGGAINNVGYALIQFNLFVGNSAVTGKTVNNTGTIGNISNNWWGSNIGPATGNVVGTKVPSWLILKLSANPTSIGNNGHTTITADLRYNNLGVKVGNSLLSGIPITFKTTLGTISQASTVNGIATSTFKSGITAGTATVSAYLDNQKLLTSVKVKDTIPPKVSSTKPKNGQTGISRTATIAIKFSENVKASTNWSKIIVKNLKTGKTVKITKSFVGTTLNIKTTTKSTANTWYIVTIPKSAIKDKTGNNLKANYTFKYKTGK